MEYKDVIVIGGGPAGLAAAIELKKNGVDNILIIEREKQLGGILRQCIHDGFGLTRFGQTLSGPEYSQLFIDMVNDLKIEYMTNATVIDLSNNNVATVATPGGILDFKARAVILTMGCRERTRGALSIPGTRPSGIYTAGVAQSYVNLYDTMVGKEVIIMGSGDIGMIMARRLTLEGAYVKAVFEVLPYASGLPRNIEQCLNDYDIPLYLSHSVVEIHGDSRVTGVTVMRCDERMRPIGGTERFFPCDTVILSVGLIPENELSLAVGVSLDDRTKGAYVDENYQTSVNGVFAAGNVLHVHDLVDFVSLEAEALAASVAEYVKNGSLPECDIPVVTDANIGHVIPQRVSGQRDFTLSLRVRKPFSGHYILVSQNGKTIKKMRCAKMIPAEMISFKIDSNSLEAVGELEVSISEK